MTARRLFAVVALIALGISACLPINPIPFGEVASLSPTHAERVYVLTGRPSSAPSFDVLARTKHCLVMIPGISSGELEEQSRFLGQLRLRNGADLAIFQDWGRLDPTRKIASATATAQAAENLAFLCKRIWGGNPQGVTIDILAHSAGTIIANKAAILLRQERFPGHFRHVLFLGTPHDTNVDLGALKELSRAVLNVCSGFDKINRDVSGELGWLQALDQPPYWNLRLDTSLGGRRIRHYAFLENTPENWLQYGFFLRSGDWPSPQALAGKTTQNPEALYRVAAWAKSTALSEAQQAEVLAFARECVSHGDIEVRYYGVALMGMVGDSSCRTQLKAILEQSDTPGYLRREIYQALGTIADPEDIRYLQRARKSDSTSGDVLRDVLRDYKINRIRPTRK